MSDQYEIPALKRTEGTLLKETVKRKTPKSAFLRKLEKAQRVPPAPANVTVLKAGAKK